MERLTHERASGIKTGYWSPAKKDALIERLAEYENTGLTPQEIIAMRAQNILLEGRMCVSCGACKPCPCLTCNSRQEVRHE